MAAVAPSSGTGPGGLYQTELGPLASLYVMQTKRGCFQELMGCDAKSEFLISTKEDQKTVLFYALEESSFCIRLICKASRPLKMTIYKGGKGDMSTPMLVLDRPYRFPLGQCKCCCYQEISVSTPENIKIGSAKETMYFCPIPSFMILDGSGGKKYELSMPVCCGGMCVNVCAEGCCNCKIPFYIYAPGGRQGGEEAVKGKIIKEWGGLATELFTSADKFSVEFPKDATPEDKAALLAGVMLVDYNFFEGGKDKNNGGAAPEAETMER